MSAGYRTVGYYDAVEYRDIPVCDKCGALVHPTALDDHDEFHEKVTDAADRAYLARCEQLGGDL